LFLGHSAKFNTGGKGVLSIMDLTGRFPFKPELKKDAYQVVSSANVFYFCHETLPLFLEEALRDIPKTAVEEMVAIRRNLPIHIP